MAMVIGLGPANWFLTLSVNDLGWADLWTLLQTRSKNAYDNRAYETIPIAESNKILNANPVICARQSMYRVRAFLSLVWIGRRVQFGNWWIFSLE